VTAIGFTSLTFTDLPSARVLAETWRAAHPDWTLWAVLVDRPPPGFADRSTFAGFDRVLTVETLGIPDLPRWLFQQERTEARAAAAAPMRLHLAALGVETVVYLPCDTAVFHPLASLPDDAAPVPDVASIAGLRFTQAGGIEADGAPLSLCRFTEPPGGQEARELWDWHARRRAALAEPGIPAGYWAFSTFTDGVPIPPAARRLVRGQPKLLVRVKDPFAPGFRQALARRAPDLF
jgi:hypothetical protein